jgi:hypothetical protein
MEREREGRTARSLMNIAYVKDNQYVELFLGFWTTLY